MHFGHIHRFDLLSELLFSGVQANGAYANGGQKRASPVVQPCYRAWLAAMAKLSFLRLRDVKFAVNGWDGEQQQ
jgi:hypothetical protein